MGTLNARISEVKRYYEDIVSTLGRAAMNEIADHPMDEEIEVILPLLMKAKRFGDASMEYAVEQAEEMDVIHEGVDVIRYEMNTLNDKLDQIDKRFDEIERMIERSFAKIES